MRVAERRDGNAAQKIDVFFAFGIIEVIARTILKGNGHARVSLQHILFIELANFFERESF